MKPNQQGATKRANFHLKDYQGNQNNQGNLHSTLAKLQGTPGVQKAHFAAPSQSITVDYEAGMTTEEHMRGLIHEDGFEVH